VDQVRAVRRQGDGAVLAMSDGSEVPVSRSAMPVLRDAGLMPGRS
jgi:DNA-binding LytR/AlgR family response regulator